MKVKFWIYALVVIVLLSLLISVVDAKGKKKASKGKKKGSPKKVDKSDRCGKRWRHAWGIKGLKSAPRAKIPIKKTVTTSLTSNGVTRTIQKGQIYAFGGCDKAGSCVVYQARAEQRNADGTTFFGQVPAKAFKLKMKGYHGRIRGSKPIKVKRKKWVRKVITTNLPRNIVHGGFPPLTQFGAPLWEYTWLAGGRFVTGGENPASLWIKGKKVGQGFNTGLFKPGQKFVDVCTSKKYTRCRILGTPIKTEGQGPGTVAWVFGYVKVSKKVKVWAWMIEKIYVPGFPPYHGNIQAKL